MIISKINPKIDEDYLTNTKENLYFDRKSAKYDLRDLANEIASFANASGGVVAVGITDKGKIEGFNIVGIDKLNDCQKVVVNYLKTSPVYKTELINVKNEKGEDDTIILFHIDPSVNTLIRNNKDEVYLRLGDSSKKLDAEQIRSMEYETRERDFETEIILDTSIDDVDIEILKEYKERTFDGNLIRQIREAENFIESQLKDFIYLHKNGLFTPEPEYPHFAWYEGLVNAVTHRSYANRGEHITFKIFDNRIEIYNPGGLGGTLTVDSMKTERYSRNPIISRTLTDFEIVRELNEGVGRMYEVMEEANLKEPKYIDKNGRSLLLILENNIAEREKQRRTDKNVNIKKELSETAKLILQAVKDKGEITSKEVANIIGKSQKTAVRELKKLIDKKLIIWTGKWEKDKDGKYKLS